MFGIDNQFDILAYYISMAAIQDLFKSKKKRERKQ